MSRYLPFALATLLVPCQFVRPVAAQGPADREELKALHGTWKVIRNEEGGKQVDKGNLVYIFTGNKVVIENNGKAISEPEVRLNAAAFPKQLDLHWDANRRDSTIYVRCGDYLIQCGNRDVDTHPREFASGTEKGGAYMLVFKKEK
jgi:uncharacterized protein (TIGR03067 family)